MPSNDGTAYLFGDFELRLTARLLARNGVPISLGAKAFDVLKCLVVRAGEVVTKDDLLKAVWPDSFVGEDNLTQQISALRRALGDCSGYIATIPGRGYQFTAQVRSDTPVRTAEELARREVAIPKAEATNLVFIDSLDGAAALAHPAKYPDEAGEESSLPIGTLREDHGIAVLRPSRREKQSSTWEKHIGWWQAVAVAAVLLAAWCFLALRERRIPLEHFTIYKLTESGDVPFTAISPDGVYLAYVRDDPENNESLWIHHIPTAAERPILQDPAFRFLNLAFSPEGFVYFLTFAFEDKPLHASRIDLYRIPLLGGRPARVAEAVDAPITFTDEGRGLCFYRETGPSSWAFISAAADGGDEKVLFTGKAPFPNEVACAPDGKRAVVEDGAGKVEVLSFDSRSRKTLLSWDRWDGLLSAMTWNSAGTGIFGIYEANDRFSRHIAFLSLPGGALHQITNDLIDYVHLSVTAKADSIAATQLERDSAFEEISLDKSEQAIEHPIDDLHWFFWIDEHTILAAGLGGVLRVVDLTDGKETALNVPRGLDLLQVARCGPKAMVASGIGPGIGARRIYTMSLDGSGVTPLTVGPNDLLPVCTPDGKWLFFNDNRSDRSPALMRVPVSGGAERKVAEAYWSSVSPDGNLVAVVDNESRRLNVFSTSSLEQLMSFPLPASVVGWTAFSADGNGVFYIDQPRALAHTKRESSIWRQRLDGGPPIKVASFPGRFIYWINSSPDGSKLGATVMTMKYDAVLLHEVR